MTSEQQWQEDVRQFGKLAYLMWQMRHTKFVGSYTLNDFSDLASNGALFYKSNVEYRRKESAALPFDKAAAIADDVVECLIGGDWFEIKGVFKKSRDSKYVVFVDSNKNRNLIALDNLRMKHPRRVGVDYSQFED